MKINTLILLLTFYEFSFSQVQDFDYIHEEVPENWTALIDGKKYVLVSVLTVKKNKVLDQFNINSSLKNITFNGNKVSYLPFLLDTTTQAFFTAYPGESSFYLTAYSTYTDGKTYTYRFPYKIHLFDSTYLIIESISPDYYFDYETGVVLTEKELKAKQKEVKETQNTSELDNLFGGISIGFKSRKKTYYVYRYEG